MYVCIGEDGTPYIYDGVTSGGSDPLVDWAEETSRTVMDTADAAAGVAGATVEGCKDTAENVTGGLQSGEYRSTSCAGFGVG